MKKLLFFAALSLAVLSAIGQSIVVTFTGRDQNCNYHPFTSVSVHNQTRGWSQTLTYPDTTLILNVTQGIADVDRQMIGLSAVVPNPFVGTATATLSLAEAEQVSFEVVRINGQRIVEKELDLPAGSHQIALSLAETQVAFLVVKTPTQRYVAKLANKGNGGSNGIRLLGSTENIPQRKAVAEGAFQVGDMMSYVGLSNDGTSAVVAKAQQANELIPLVFTEDTVSVGFDANGASYSLFSVSETRQVKFSKGNLQYQASTGMWRFAEHQYDYIGDDNANISSTYSGWIDLFGWGTSGWNSGATAYQPWSTSTTYTDYYSGGSDANNLTGAYANADWGVYNAIFNGGNQAGMWRTLALEEWSYLLYYRNASTVSGIENARFAKATVGSATGVIVFPDSFTLPSGISVVDGSINNTDATFADNTYTTSEWLQLEGNGALFIPAAGGRNGSRVLHVGTSGNYWSSSCNEEFRACLVSFYCNYGNCNVYVDSYYCHAGFSVRLVKD